MKNTFAFACILFFALFTTTAIKAQKTATWKGGTPGKVQEWNCPTNWKEGRVPDAFCDVIIPDVATNGGSQPLISSAVNEVNSLSLMPGARLRIAPAGSLEVLENMQALAESSIENHGMLKAPVSERKQVKMESYLVSNR